MGTAGYITSSVGANTASQPAGLQMILRQLKERQELAVSLQRARIRGEVLMRSELLGVHEHAGHDEVVVLARLRSQPFAALTFLIRLI